MDTLLNRRKFLKTSIAVSPVLTMPNIFCTKKKDHQRPNIIVILTDQQSASMMSCVGNKYLRTPAMDSLAQSGVLFERAYCTNPVCAPSRFSLMTGRMPSEIGLRSNGAQHIKKIPENIKQNGLGFIFKRAGYDVAYGGKVHLPKLNVNDIGFEYICKNERDELAHVCADYISQERDKPFLLIASFINPHDICYMAIRDFVETDGEKKIIERGLTETKTLDKALALHEGITEKEFFEKYFPPLPDNFNPQEDEPEAIRWLISQRPFRRKTRDKWTKKQWRKHRWAYCRLTEMVDAQIGQVLKALHKRGKAENTIVVFTSDHGDMDAAHKLEHKTVFYDEACRKPLVFSWPGKIEKGKIDREHLVSNGLDLIPTLCDFAGIDKPKELRGVSVRPVLEGKKLQNRRRCLPVESEIGKMIVSKRYKYIVYDKGKTEEQLLDLQKAPPEMYNVASDSEKQNVLYLHRTLFSETFEQGHYN